MTDSSSQQAATAPVQTPGAVNDRTFAIVAHIAGLLTNWIGPLVIFLIKKSDPAAAFSTENAKEALNWQITICIALVACFILSFVLIGLFLLWVVFVANLVLCILASVKASNGVAYRYPFAIRFVK